MIPDSLAYLNPTRVCDVESQLFNVTAISYAEKPREQNSGEIFRRHERKTRRKFGENFRRFSSFDVQENWPQEISQKNSLANRTNHEIKFFRRKTLGACRHNDFFPSSTSLLAILVGFLVFCDLNFCVQIAIWTRCHCVLWRFRHLSFGSHESEKN